MVGQPDWQRYQTNAGPLLMQQNNVVRPSTNFIYVGSWQSIFVYIANLDASQLLRVELNFYEDSLGAQGVFTRFIVLGNGKYFYRRLPVYARYMQVTSTQLISGSTNLVSMWIAPHIGAPTPMYMDDPNPLINVINQSVPASGEIDLFPSRITSGLVRLLVWQSSTSLRFNVRFFDTGGTLQYLAVVSWSSINVINEQRLMLPDSPVTVQCNNTDGAAAHLFHLSMLPDG